MILLWILFEIIYYKYGFKFYFENALEIIFTIKMNRK